MNFRIALCSWEEVMRDSDFESRLTDVEVIASKRFAPNKYGIRMCNESCSDTLSSGLFGMVSHITQLSYLSELQIYRLWYGYKHDIRMLLLKNIYLEHNTFEIKQSYLYNINAFQTTQMPATYKAKGGATMKAFTEQVMSVFNSMSRSEGTQQPRQENLSDKVRNLFAVKK